MNPFFNFHFSSKDRFDILLAVLHIEDFGKRIKRFSKVDTRMTRLEANRLNRSQPAG